MNKNNKDLTKLKCVNCTRIDEQYEIKDYIRKLIKF